MKKVRVASQNSSQNYYAKEQDFTTTTITSTTQVIANFLEHKSNVIAAVSKNLRSIIRYDKKNF